MSNVFWVHIWPIISLLGLAFFTSLAISGFMIAAGLGDEPNNRSNHISVTPTAGGLSLIAAFGAGSLALVILYPNILSILPETFPQILSLIFAMGFLGLCDDVFEIPAKLKFGMILILSAFVVSLIGFPDTFPVGPMRFEIPAFIGFAGAVLWVFVVTNAVNFMDGVNGLINNTLILASIALGLVGLSNGSILSAFLLGILAAGFLGFMPYNHRRKAAIFCGDTGALVAGFVFSLATLEVTSVSENNSLLYLGPLLILPLLADTLLTLAYRAKNKEDLLQAHRDHLYQRLVKYGFSHLQVTWFYTLCGLIFANIGLYAVKYDAITSPLFFAANVLILTILYFIVGRWIKRAR